jgi:hypothetical protein
MLSSLIRIGPFGLVYWASKPCSISKSLGPLAFNFVQLDITWVEPSSSDKARVFADTNAVY